MAARTVPKVTLPSFSDAHALAMKDPANVTRCFVEVQSHLKQRTDLLAAMVASIVATEARNDTQPFWSYRTTADPLAATATLDTVIGMLGAKSITIGSVFFLPFGALAADDANYATITITRHTAGSTYAIAQATTQKFGTGNWTALSRVAIPPVATSGAAAKNATFNPYDVLSYSIAKTGAGVIVPAGMIAIFA